MVGTGYAGANPDFKCRTLLGNDLVCRPFAGHRGARLRAQLMPPTRANTRRTRVTRDTKDPKAMRREGGEEETEGGHGRGKDMGVHLEPATPYGFQQLTARLINKVRYEYIVRRPH